MSPGRRPSGTPSHIATPAAAIASPITTSSFAMRRRTRPSLRSVPCPRKKYPISYAAVSGASDPCVALRSIDVPNSRRSVPAAAFAGSVAPIRSRHFAMASGASSTMSTTGPDDMKSVRPPKNGLSRWTA